MKKIVLGIAGLCFLILIVFSLMTPYASSVVVPAASKIERSSFFVDANQPMVAITYDDGPHPTVTSEILDILEKYNAHATFFVIGDRISHHSEEIKRIISLGCELGNHTYGHLDLSQLQEAEINEQLKISEEELASVIESVEVLKLVRPPFGNTNRKLLETCPYPLITWSIDTRDWSHQNADRSAETVMNQVQDGDIILMHDMYEATVSATEKIVHFLSEEGYQMVTVTEMFEAKGIALEPGKVYRHAH